MWSGEYYLKEEPGQRYRISRLKVRQLSHRADYYYCSRTYLKMSVAMNYYVPIQRDEECEKHASLKPRYTPYIFTKRYPLTPTSYKYLDIGINVGSMSRVEIAIGDNRGNRMILPYATWKVLIEKRADIEQLMQPTASSASFPIQDLIVEFVKIRDGHCVKLSLHDTCLYMKPSTMLFMLDLEHCVEHAYVELYANVYCISDTFTRFISYLRRNCITNKNDAAHVLRKIYDKKSLIECELIAYALDHIIYHTFHE